MHRVGRACGDPQHDGEESPRQHHADEVERQRPQTLAGGLGKQGSGRPRESYDEGDDFTIIRGVHGVDVSIVHAIPRSLSALIQSLESLAEMTTKPNLCARLGCPLFRHYTAEVEQNAGSYIAVPVATVGGG